MQRVAAAWGGGSRGPMALGHLREAGGRGGERHRHLAGGGASQRRNNSPDTVATGESLSTRL